MGDTHSDIKSAWLKRWRHVSDSKKAPPDGSTSLMTSIESEPGTLINGEEEGKYQEEGQRDAQHRSHHPFVATATGSVAQSSSSSSEGIMAHISKSSLYQSHVQKTRGYGTHSSNKMDETNPRSTSVLSSLREFVLEVETSTCGEDEQQQQQEEEEIHITVPVKPPIMFSNSRSRIVAKSSSSAHPLLKDKKNKSSSNRNANSSIDKYRREALKAAKESALVNRILEDAAIAATAATTKKSTTTTTATKQHKPTTFEKSSINKGLYQSGFQSLGLDPSNPLNVYILTKTFRISFLDDEQQQQSPESIAESRSRKSSSSKRKRKKSPNQHLQTEGSFIGSNENYGTNGEFASFQDDIREVSDEHNEDDIFEFTSAMGWDNNDGDEEEEQEQQPLRIAKPPNMSHDDWSGIPKIKYSVSSLCVFFGANDERNIVRCFDESLITSPAHAKVYALERAIMACSFIPHVKIHFVSDGSTMNIEKMYDQIGAQVIQGWCVPLMKYSSVWQKIWISTNVVRKKFKLPAISLVGIKSNEKKLHLQFAAMDKLLRVYNKDLESTLLASFKS